MTNLLPAGITTALVHMDAPLSFIGDPGRLHVTITPSVALVWAATGTPIADFIDTIYTDPGVDLEIDLPHTDQPGFLNSAGEETINWSYRVKVKYEKNGQKKTFPDRDFQIPSGQTAVDLALIPAGTAVTPPVSAPVGTVSSVNGRTGAVILTQADVGLSVVDNTSDADKPVSAATQLAINAVSDVADEALVLAGNAAGTPIMIDGGEP